MDPHSLADTSIASTTSSERRVMKRRVLRYIYHYIFQSVFNFVHAFKVLKLCECSIKYAICNTPFII